MDIFNHSPSISEDTLHYVLYPPLQLADRASCTSLVVCIDDLVQTLLPPDFLWHRDSLQLRIVPDPDARGQDKNILEGRMRVGDAVDDEWCVVWLLREISLRWDVAISASDLDGEILLIEAAESLPRWVSPSNATNRVWLHSGRVHLIPLSYTSPPDKPRKRPRIPSGRVGEGEYDFNAHEQDRYIAIEDALTRVRDVSVDTLAPKAVEDAVWQRISGYPDAAHNHVHATMAYLPVDIARALAIDRSLIQKPVETFYTRDALQLRVVHKMARFPPRPDVLCRIKMTRTAYAQLLSQKFYAPKIFGIFKEREGTAAWRWRDVGTKLACGFEMLFQESKNRADVVKPTTEALASSAEARKDTLRRSSDYKAYLTRLVAIGYFRNEAEGSCLWNELENKAIDVYLKTGRDDDTSRPSFAALFNAALSRAPETLSDAELAQREDPDTWMNVDAKDFDGVLEHAMRAGSTVETFPTETAIQDTEEDRVAKEQTDKLRDLATKVERFVEGKGDVEGAQFEDERFSDGEGTDSDDESLFSDEEFSDSDDKESEGERQEMPELTRQHAMDNLVPALPAPEYGKMPASFSTQRVARTTTLTEQVGTRSPEVIGQFGPPVRARPIRPPLLTRNEYEGVDSDDESSSSDPFAGGDEEDVESEEDRPQVVGEVDVDMNEEEAEFLEFSRQTLGISDEMWDDIIRERRGRGAFVPASVTTGKMAATPKTMSEQSRPLVPSVDSKTNPNLDSFEVVMQAMDAELLRLRQSAAGPGSSPPSAPTKEDKGKARATVTDVDINMDIEASMQVELESLLEQESAEQSDEEANEPSLDYNLIKNFLESFKSQAGLPGPVGNLAGRLQPGWTLPRDESQ